MGNGLRVSSQSPADRSRSRLCDRQRASEMGPHRRWRHHPSVFRVGVTRRRAHSSGRLFVLLRGNRRETQDRAARHRRDSVRCRCGASTVPAAGRPGGILRRGRALLPASLQFDSAGNRGMSVDVTRYLEMERAFYADLVARSNFKTEAFTRTDTSELVVGSYVHHESLDYERWLLSGVRVRRGALGLEYGCGPGRMILRLAPHFERVDGIDISQEVLDVAKRRCAALPSTPRLFLTDGQSVPEGTEGGYDVAFSVICLQHICVYSVRRRIFEGLYRALKPGGLLTIQMGYGPGHARMIDYFEDFIDAPGANGMADVGVLHPSEIAGDLAGVGFTQTAYVLTPTGPGDTHGAWIFVRALKPGPHAALIATDPAEWQRHGFVPLASDDAGMARARQRHQQHGIVARCRDAEQEAAVLRAAALTTEQETAACVAKFEHRMAGKDCAIAYVE